ncbi:MAG: hypothetical protein SFX73_10425, partial [Kofleriaceae bacterium]|nr:hypothetical protein [Kofleriaceae bacterium]
CDIDRQGTGLSRPAPRERSGTGTGTGTGTGAGRENRRGAAFLSALLEASWRQCVRPRRY